MFKLNDYIKNFRGFISVILLGVVSLLAFIPILTYVYFAKDLETKDHIMNRKNTGVVLLDRKDRPFFKFYEAKISEFIPLNEVPQQLREAVIVGEDKEFYMHPGFSIKGIIGALMADIKHRSLAYGGSTITQQLTKNALLKTDRNFLRKYQEIVLSSEIERRFTKDEILELYLNSVYLGEGAFGVEDASKVYFNKSARDLNLAEASMLAAILPAPSSYSPLNGGLKKAKERQSHILKEMVEEKYITDEQKNQVENEKLVFNQNGQAFDFQAPHFALYVKKQLEDQYGEEKIARSGFKIKTTLDLDKQTFAEKVVETQVQRLSRNSVSNGAAIVLEAKTGEILAMVGSKDWEDEKFGKLNIVTTPRQPGSSFKPIVYAKALEEHLITPATVLKDQLTNFPSDGDPESYGFKECSKGNKAYETSCYKPKNYDNKFRGNVLVRRALANSLNVPSVEIMNKVGVTGVLEMAKRLGIDDLEDPSNYGLSLVLGAGEVDLLDLTSAYSVFANKGEQVKPTAILEIKDKNDKKVFSYNPESKKVLDAGVAFQIASILSDARARLEIFGSALNNTVNAAVKTGTTESYKDALTMGFTPNLVVGVWVGNNDNTPMDQVAGSLGAAPIFRSLIERFSQDYPQESFTPPDDVIKTPFCFGAKTASSSASVEYFLKGTEPERKCLFVPNATPSASPSPPTGSPPPTPSSTN